MIVNFPIVKYIERAKCDYLLLLSFMVNFTSCDLLFNLSTLDKNILQFLLIDDHEIVRTGINLLLSKIYHPVVIHEAADGENATAL